LLEFESTINAMKLLSKAKPDVAISNRDVISVFSRGRGQNFDRLLRGGQNRKNTTFCWQKHKKVTIFQNQGGANAPPK